MMDIISKGIVWVIESDRKSVLNGATDCMPGDARDSREWTTVLSLQTDWWMMNSWAAVYRVSKLGCL